MKFDSGLARRGLGGLPAARGSGAAVALLAVLAGFAPATAQPVVQLGTITNDVYIMHDLGIRIALPPALARERWTREFFEVSDQVEVQFGDGQCRRYHFKRIAGPVGQQVAADAAARGSEAVMRAVASQFAVRRGELQQRADWMPAKQGAALLSVTTDTRGWPCVAPFPAGGQTLGAAWFVQRGGQFYEIGYQAGLAEGEATEAAWSEAQAQATVLLDGIEFPAPGRVQPTFPWHSGDPPPRLAGITVGDSREFVEELFGPIDSSLDPEEWQLEDEKRGLLVMGSAGMGVEMVVVSRREDGDLAGVRVGDRFEDAVRKWGPPAEGGPIMPDTDMVMYYAGEWGVTLVVTKGRIDSLAIATGETHEAPSPETPVVGATSQAPVHTDALPADEEITVGRRFVLPAGALANHTGDSVAQEMPGREVVAINIADIETTGPALPGSAPARERLAALLGSGPVAIEVTSVVVLEGIRMLAGRVSVGGKDVAATLVEDGWAIAVKSRSADPRLLAAEAAARGAKRGLWGMSLREFHGVGPEEYLASDIALGMSPETYSRPE